MESKRLMIYLVSILAVLIGMLVYLFVQIRQLTPEEGGEGSVVETEVDLVNGGSIFIEGKDLKGRMIPISGGPPWLLTDGGGCAACHGEKGEGGKPVRALKIVVPNIKESVEKGIGGMSEEDFVRLIKWGDRPNGKSLSHEMPRFELSGNEVKDLLAFIRQL